MGTTNLISEALTAKSPQAAPLIETETPLSSIGKAGARFDSDALALLTVAGAGARVSLDRMMPNSPAAKPVGATCGLTEALGDGLGLGLGLGDGLTAGLGVAVGLAIGTDISLAPVNNVSVPGDSVVITGES